MYVGPTPSWPGTLPGLRRINLLMSTLWTIEPLTARTDIDAVLAIEEASFTSPWTREMYLAEFENPGISFFYLAKTPLGEIIGFCSFWRVLDELHLNNLAVAPEHRRSGVATALLQKVLGDGAQFGAQR